jgi:hypothetical protein
VQLAERLGISASYLNLIEHNQRSLTAALLLKLARELKLDLASLSEDNEARLTADLSEIFGDAIFEEHPVTVADIRDLAANPAASRAVLALYQAYEGARESAQAMASRLSDGAEVPGLDAARLPSEEVSDVIQDARNYFGEIEEAAERLTWDAQLDLDDLFNGMARYLSEAHGIEMVVTDVGSDRTALRRYEPATKRLYISEMLPPRSRNFQVAHQIGLLAATNAFQKVIDRARLSTPDSIALCRVTLASYFAGALLMPYAAFLEAAEAMRYDTELLGHRFRTSFEQVCHRMTTLQRPGAEGVPFHLIRVDIAGNISKRFSASGIHFARFSGLCPRWNVHAAFMTPGQIQTQLSRMPDGTTYFCIARTVRKGHRGHGTPHTLHSIGLGCEVQYARRLVYADGVDLNHLEAAVPIGITCRLCERLDCEQRAFPPIQHRLEVDENVRRVSFYAPAVKPER